MWRYVAVPALFVIVLQVTTVTVFGTPEAPTSDEDEMKYGRQKAKQGMYPWTVALFRLDHIVCTASIISPYHIMTAARCVVLNEFLLPVEIYHGIAGNVNKSSPEYRINFANFTVHPNYEDNYENLENDIAILRVTEPIPFSETLRPICIAAPKSDAGYEEARIMGWGSSFTFNVINPLIYDIMLWSNQTIIPDRQCKIRYGEHVTDQTICATGFAVGVCDGQFGMPLVHRQDGSPIQIGIASYVQFYDACSSTNASLILYTRVSSYTDFITQTADDVCVI